MLQIKRLWIVFGFFCVVASVAVPLHAGPRVGHRFVASAEYCNVPCKTLHDRRGVSPYYAPETVYSGVSPLVNKSDPREVVYIVDDTVRCIVYGGWNSIAPYPVDTIHALLERYTGATTWRRISGVGFFERVENEFLPIDTSYRKFVNKAGTLIAYHGRAFYAHSRYRLTIMTNTFPRLCAEKKKKSGEVLSLLAMYRLNDTAGLKNWAEKWHDESKKCVSGNESSDRNVRASSFIINDFLGRITRPGGDSMLGSAPPQPYYVMATALSIRVATDTARGDYGNYLNIGLDLTVNNFYPAGDLPAKKILYLDDMRRFELVEFLGRSELCNAFNVDLFQPPDETEAEQRRLFLSRVIEVHQTGQIKWCAVREWQCRTEPALTSITFDPSGTKAVIGCETESYGCTVEYRADTAGWHLSGKLREWVY